jgi:uncharacterized protein (DUF2345 family)
MAGAFSSAAVTHQTVGLAGHLGAVKAEASLLDEKSPPLNAMLASISGQVHVAGASSKVPYSDVPMIGISARDGFGANAAQSLQLANGETVTVASGQDTQFVAGGQMRMHSGQAIGVLGGTVAPGEGRLGLQIIATKDAVDIQAQADALKVQARDAVNVVSANAHVDWAAAKRIRLSTAGGASITIEGGNILVECPGKITVHAGKKNLNGPCRTAFELPLLPQGDFELRKNFPFSL